MRRINLILGLIGLVILVWLSGSWFDSTADKALAKCTAVEQALGECQPSNKGPEPPEPPPIDDLPLP